MEIKSNSAEERIFFPNLDGFRFLSFLIVFLLHGFAEVVNHHEVNGFILTTLKIAFFQSGQLGVSFFFVLSGFLITYLIFAERIKIGRFDMKAFYIRRSLRIFPLYFAFMIFIFVILPFFVDLKLPNPFYYFFFLSNFDVVNTNGAGMDILNISWSVSVEEQFYLAWAILFAILTPRHYLYLFLTIIITSALFRWTNSSNHYVTMFHTFSVMSDLAIGGLSAYLVTYSERFKKLFEDLPKWIIMGGYGLVIPMLMFSRFFYLYTTFGRIFLGLGIAFIIIEQNYSNNSFYKMKNFKLISSLGKYTYGLYLLHPLVILFVSMTAIKIGLDTKSLLEGSFIGVFSLVMSILVCYLSYRFFESPFLKLKSRFAYLKTYQTNYREETDE